MKKNISTLVCAFVLIFSMGTAAAQTFKVEIKGLRLDSANMIAANTGGVVVADTTKKERPPVDSVFYYVAVLVPSQTFADSMAKANIGAYTIVSRKGTYEPAKLANKVPSSDTLAKKGVELPREIVHTPQNETPFAKNDTVKIFQVGGTTPREAYFVAYLTSANTVPTNLRRNVEAFRVGNDWVNITSQAYFSKSSADSVAKETVGGFVLPALNEPSQLQAGKIYRVRLCTTTNKPEKLPTNTSAFYFGDKWYWYSSKVFLTANEAEQAKIYFQNPFYDAFIQTGYIGGESITKN